MLDRAPYLSMSGPTIAELTADVMLQIVRPRTTFVGFVANDSAIGRKRAEKAYPPMPASTKMPRSPAKTIHQPRNGCLAGASGVSAGTGGVSTLAMRPVYAFPP